MTEARVSQYYTNLKYHLPGEVDEEEGLIVESDIGGSDHETFHTSAGFEVDVVVRSITLLPTAPTLSGRDPLPNQTGVLRNKPVSFVLCGHNQDPVDIDSVRIQIGQVVYQNGDPEFYFSGNTDNYSIEVSHPVWGYEETVDIKVDASSLLGEAMATVSYSFSTEWESTKNRGTEGKIELYKAADYSFSVLTLQEDWYRQGEERHSIDLEIWYGRYQKLPFIEELEMRLIAGDTNALGKEILDNSWLSVKVEDGEWEPMGPDTVILLGPMFSHSKKRLFLKLLIPEIAATKKYFVLHMEFKPRSFLPWGRLLWGKAIWGDSELIYDIHPSTILYRAFVFDAEMWSKYERAGFIPFALYRGEDKKW